MKSNEFFDVINNHKITRFNDDAHVTIMPTSDLSIDITQNSKDKTYTLKTGKYEDVKSPMMEGRDSGEYQSDIQNMQYTTLGEVLDRPTVFNMVEQLGILADAVVERKEDLEDFREPVIMHKQSTKEKGVILSEVSKMKPGDELSFSRPDMQSADGNYVTKGETVRLACVEKDTFQYVITDRYNSRKTEEEKVPKVHQVTKDMLLANPGTEKAAIRVHPDGLVINQAESYKPSELSNVKISKGKYTAEEINDLKNGKAINLDTVLDRNPIQDKSGYISYVMEHNRPNFTKGDEKAWGTMKMEWDRGFNNTPAWKRPEDLPEKDQKRINALPKDQQKEELRKIGYMEKDALEKKIRDTQHMVIDASNTDRLDAIITLRRAAEDMRQQGKEWRKLAKNCDEIASKLPNGDNLKVTAASLMDKSDSLSMVTDKLKGMYPDIDKGLNKLNERRTEDVMKSFLSEQEKILAKQKEKNMEKAMEKENKPKKAKGIRRKKSSKSMER